MQPQRRLQGRFAHGLAAHVLRRIVRRQRRVGRRVVAHGVDAVDHAVHFPADGVHHALQPLGVPGIVELRGVGGADSGDGVGHEHGALHEIHVAVHAQGAVVIPAAIQPEQLIHAVRAVAPLVLDVVDGEHRADAPHLRPAGGHILQIDGHQRRLPVVAVEHVGHPVEAGQQVDDRVAEEGEALAVVKFAVQPSPAEVFLVVHEIPRHAQPLQREQAAVLVPPAQIHVDIPAERHLPPPLLPDPVIQRQDHRRLHAGACQRRGQAARHVCQTAGLAEGVRFAGHIQNSHAVPPCLTPWRPWRSRWDSARAPSASHFR